MSLVAKFFESIERSDVTKDMSNLVSDAIIDSLDIIGLVAVIEKHYQKPLRAEFIEASNFESFEAIEKMLEEAMK